MPQQAKKVEVTAIAPIISIDGVSLSSAIANVQIEVKADGSATFYLVGNISDPNQVQDLKNYLQNF